MVQINVQVGQQAGLHARPAAAMVKLTNSFKSEITLQYQAKCINAKSMIAILSWRTWGRRAVDLFYKRAG